MKRGHLGNSDAKSRFELSFDLPNPGLKAYLANVRKGQSKVYTAPFAKGESTPRLLRAWGDILKSIQQRWPTLWEFEMDLAKKVGPMSVMKPLKQRMKDIRSYYDDILLSSRPLDVGAIRRTSEEFSCLRGMSLRSINNTVVNMKLSTNSGSPYFTRRSSVLVPHGMEFWKHNGMWFQDYDLFKTGSFVFGAPAILGWRGQEGGLDVDDVKQRVVWMFPFYVNIAELQLYQPAIERLQHDNVVPAWVSMDAVDHEITRLFDTKREQDLIVCTDFSKFDQHFNSTLQQAAKTVIGFSCRTREVDKWLTEVFPIKYSIPLVYDWDKVMVGEHGMGSGSGGTNFDETIAHRCLQHEAAMSIDQELNPHSMCLGDDGILSYPFITTDEVVECYSAHGLEMNPDKQYASTQDCVFLRRWHHADYRIDGECVGVYSTMRALGRLRYLERFMDPDAWGPKQVALRQLSILENVKYHPMAEEFVEFCMKRDKYRLGIDIPGFLDRIVDLAKESIANMPDFLGYTKSLQSGTDPTGGIANWWIVNYLKSVR